MRTADAAVGVTVEWYMFFGVGYALRVLFHLHDVCQPHVAHVSHKGRVTDEDGP